MTSPQPHLEEVLKALQSQNELLLQIVRDSVSPSQPTSQAPTGRDRANSRAATDILNTPPLRPISTPTLTSSEFGLPGSLRHSRRQIPEQLTHERRTLFAEPKHIPASLHSNFSTGTSHESAEDDIPFLPLLEQPLVPRPQQQQQQQRSSTTTTTEARGVTRLLEAAHLEDKDLLYYLFNTDFKDGTAVAMQDFIKKRAGTSIEWAQSLRHFAAYENESYSNSTCEVYDVGIDCVVRQVQGMEELFSNEQGGDGGCACDDEGSCSAPEQVDAAAVWDKIKNINYPTGEATGRITIVQEPTALVFGSLHFAMSKYLNMDELLTHLVTSQGNANKTTAYMNRAFPPEPISQPTPSPAEIDTHPRVMKDPYIRHRSFFFVFKYYTVVSQDHEPAPWEKFDKRPADKKSQDHIDIAECSSVLALSLGGEPTQTRIRRRRGKPPREGYVFDTFAPWHLLNIQSFPDDEHTDRSEDEGKTLLNGPHAFLEALVVEYQDATRRNRILHEKITKLVTPDINFMFDNKIRDKLLFEDKHFTYIRRYFWAYMSLGVINTSIKSMLTAYDETFTPAFWSGTHPTLWAHPDPSSPSGQYYLSRLASLRADLDRVLADLWAVYLKNEETRREIQSLREQLFSGSSIMESRRAIEQGDNIRILTLSSMVFLPLTFVTSVFGITEFTIPATDWRFSTTMVCVCVPFIILLILLQSRSVNNAIHKAFERLRARTFTGWRSAADSTGPARVWMRSWGTWLMSRNRVIEGERVGFENDEGGVKRRWPAPLASAGLPSFPKGPMGKTEEKRLWGWIRGIKKDDGEKV